MPKRIRTASGRPLEESARAAIEELERRAQEALDAAATVWEAETKNLLRQPGRGRLYRRGSVGHQASAPGDPPAPDTGRLLGSIGWERVQTFVRRLGSNVRHALHLERGTTRIEPRPWLMPSIHRALPKMRQALRAAFRR